MAKFDRSQWKPTPISAVQEEENRSKETARFFGSNNYTTYYTIEDGENEFRILPNHEPGKSAYVATRTALLECEGDKYENGQIVGKEVRNRKVFIATTHSAGKMKEDPIETYIEFAQELAKSQFDDPKQQEKFLNPIRGYRQGTKWVPGILPNSEFVAYVVGKQGIGRLNLRNKWLKDMQDLSIQQTAGDVIAIDIFSHPTQGFPLVIHKGLSAQNQTEYKVYTRPLKVGEGWDDFFKKYAITDEQWNTWENLPHLNDLFVGSYSQKDFNMALDGLKRFDEKHGYNIFGNEEFLDRIEAMAELVPEDKPKADAAPKSPKQAPNEIKKQDKYPQDSRIKMFLREYIAENAEVYGEGAELPVFDTQEELHEWYDIAMAGGELPLMPWSNEEAPTGAAPKQEKEAPNPVNTDVASPVKEGSHLSALERIRQMKGGK